MPPATAEDVGKSVIVGEDGKYELAEAGNPLPVPVLPEDVGKTIIVDKNGGYTLAEAGSGATVLTLYAKENDNYLYLDSACTQKFRNDIAAMSAIDNATSIVIKQDSSYRQRRYYPASLYRLWFTSGDYAVYLLANAFTVAEGGGTLNPPITPEVKQFTLVYFHD